MSHRSTPTRRFLRSPASWWVMLVACAVTYLYTSLPFGNPHIGYLPPMGGDHGAQTVSTEAGPMTWVGGAQADFDDAQLWAALEEAPTVLPGVGAGSLILMLVWHLVSRRLPAKRRQRAPPSAPLSPRSPRGPPLPQCQPWRLGSR